MKKILFLIALLSGVSPVFAQGIPVYDNAAFMQWLQQAAAQAKDYAVQTQALQTQITSMKSLTEGLGSSLNINTGAEIQKGLEAVMQNAIPSMSAMSGSASQAADKLKASYGVDSEFSKTLLTTRGTIAGAITNGAQQQDQLKSEAQRIKDLAAQSQAATGLLEAQQAGNQISVELAQQTQKMRAQQLALDEANLAALMQAQRQKESETELSRRFFGGAKVDAAALKGM